MRLLTHLLCKPMHLFFNYSLPPCLTLFKRISIVLWKIGPINKRTGKPRKVNIKAKLLIIKICVFHNSVEPIYIYIYICVITVYLSLYHICTRYAILCWVYSSNTSTKCKVTNCIKCIRLLRIVAFWGRHCCFAPCITNMPCVGWVRISKLKSSYDAAEDSITPKV